MNRHNDRRRMWIAAAAFTTTVLVLAVRSRRQKRNAARQTAADAARDALQKEMQRSLLPVLVSPTDLPVGWGVAPPVFYPPHCAAIPLVLPGDMAEVERSRQLHTRAHITEGGPESAPSAFIFCTYVGMVVPSGSVVEANGAAAASANGAAASQETLLADLLKNHPVLQQQFGELTASWTSLDLLPSSEDTTDGLVPPVFTHILVTPDNSALLGGVNGAYFVVAVLSGFQGIWNSSTAAAVATPQPPPSSSESSVSANSDVLKAASPTANPEAVMDLAGVVRGVARAALRVPLPALKSATPMDAVSRLPGGAAFAVHRGHYRVVCSRDGKELELCVPVEWAVRSGCVNMSVATPQPTPAGSPPLSGAAPADGAAVGDEGSDALLTLVFTPSVFMPEDVLEVEVTPAVFDALVANPQDAVASLWKVSEATSTSNPVAEASLKGVTTRLLTASEHARDSVVTMGYVQPKFGVQFSVHPLLSVVYEPWMTDLPTILYYPLGEQDVDADGDAGGAAPPLMSIEYVLELPSTWEVLAKSEEELVHNVLFHFTNWEVATVTTSMTEISGIRGVMFHEVRQGRRCRSYILPRGNTVLIVRWETAAETWDKYLSIFQQTLDTLHLDATPVTK